MRGGEEEQDEEDVHDDGWKIYYFLCGLWEGPEKMQY